MRRLVPVLCALTLIGAPAAAALPEIPLPDYTGPQPEETIGDLFPLPPENDQDAAPPPGEGADFAESVTGGFQAQMALYSAVGAAAALLGLAGFALVTRHISPKDALKNPQRAMIYGFIRATPGAHLKRLSEEFGMKSSSILWHVRKLESADLVRSQRANGYRVFYPVAGGQELRRVTRGLTALHNRNAARAVQYLDRHPGSATSDIARGTGINAGTVRWHLRKLRDFGLLEELVSDAPSRYFLTPLGQRTLERHEGAPGGEVPTRPRAPVSHPESA